MSYGFRRATPADLERIWDKNIAANPGSSAWLNWREDYLRYNREGLAETFVVLCDGDPVGEGTLLLSPECGAINGCTALCDGKHRANVNALRIEKAHEGRGYISRLVNMMERAAAERGITTLTIGVDAHETRNLAIYLHWGYTRFVMSEVEDGCLVLYYAKEIGGSPVRDGSKPKS